MQEKALNVAKLPETEDEALKNETWKAAMDDEFNSLLGRETWQVVDRPKNRKFVSSRWVFDLTPNALGQIVRTQAQFLPSRAKTDVGPHVLVSRKQRLKFWTSGIPK